MVAFFFRTKRAIHVLVLAFLIPLFVACGGDGDGAMLHFPESGGPANVLYETTLPGSQFFPVAGVLRYDTRQALVSKEFSRASVSTCEEDGRRGRWVSGLGLSDDGQTLTAKRHLPPGEYVANVELKSGNNSQTRFTIAEGGASNLEVVLTAPFTYEFQVENERGRRVKDAEVRVYRDYQPFTVYGVRESNPSPDFQTRSNQLGTAAITLQGRPGEQISPKDTLGMYSVTFDADGYIPCVESITVGPEREANRMTIRLRPTPDPLPLYIRVLHGAGRTPVSWGWCRFESGNHCEGKPPEDATQMLKESGSLQCERAIPKLNILALANDGSVYAQLPDYGDDVASVSLDVILHRKVTPAQALEKGQVDYIVKLTTKPDSAGGYRVREYQYCFRSIIGTIKETSFSASGEVLGTAFIEAE